MCTSFVSYGDRTLIGMNFDISDRAIKLVYQKDSQLLVMQQEKDAFFPALGINKSGTFMNLHMVEENAAGAYRRGKNCVHIMKLFDDVLSEKLALEDVPAFASDHAIVNVPGYSVHSLIANGERRACLVEPGRKPLQLDSEDVKFVVQTNFSLMDAKDSKGAADGSYGVERFHLANERLASVQGRVGVEDGFSVLQETAQLRGDFPTQLSLISVPEEGVVYFALQADFERIFSFSFHDQQIRTKQGFQTSRNSPVTRKGVLLSELSGW